MLAHLLRVAKLAEAVREAADLLDDQVDGFGAAVETPSVSKWKRQYPLLWGRVGMCRKTLATM
jgi:hypothetical protein